MISLVLFQPVSLILLITASLKLTLMYSTCTPIRSFHYQLSVKLLLKLFLVFNNLLLSPINLSNSKVVFLDVFLILFLKSINQRLHWFSFLTNPMKFLTSPQGPGLKTVFFKVRGSKNPLRCLSEMQTSTSISRKSD